MPLNTKGKSAISIFLYNYVFRIKDYFSAPYLNGVNAFVACLVCNSIKTILIVLECISLLFTCRVNLLPPVSFLLGNVIKKDLDCVAHSFHETFLLLNTWPVTLLPRQEQVFLSSKLKLFFSHLIIYPDLHFIAWYYSFADIYVVPLFYFYLWTSPMEIKKKKHPHFTPLHFLS